AVYLDWVKKTRRTTPLGLEICMRRLTDGINHVLKSRPSTHGCQHIVEIGGDMSYPHAMANAESLVDALVESGRHELAGGLPAGRVESLALLQFADLLRRSA